MTQFEEHLNNSVEDLVDMIMLDIVFDYNTETSRLKNEAKIKEDIYQGLMDIRFRKFSDNSGQ